MLKFAVVEVVDNEAVDDDDNSAIIVIVQVISFFHVMDFKCIDVQIEILMSSLFPIFYNTEPGRVGWVHLELNERAVCLSV